MNHKYLYKRRKWREINAGVFHGIKKPKPPKLKVNKESSKEISKNVDKSVNKKQNYLKFSNVKQIDQINTNKGTIIEKTILQVDSNKRFLKENISNSTIQQPNVANVIVNPSNKLKELNNQIERNESKNSLFKNSSKSSKSIDISLNDATDLDVERPEFKLIIKNSKIDDILKVLEDDWADDEYDNMETLVSNNMKNTFSPLKSIISPSNIEISPTNELSKMMSMNIKDVPSIIYSKNSSSTIQNLNDMTEVEKENKEKYYPLFNKGYSMKNAENDVTKFTYGIKKSTKWQLSAKGGGSENQYQLDAGQKRFGATQCSECGIVYQLGDPEDENAHLNYHNSVKTLKFQGWKNERIIMEDPITSSRIILIEPNDSKQHWKKVSEILTVVDRDLGLVDSSLPNYTDKKVYLYIREKNILGVLVAEYIEIAHRMIPELIDLNCCTAESTPAKCGINVVWTAMSHRRQGIATKLVDTLRSKFFYGYIMSLEDIAFSVPTPSGKIFAEKYTKTKSFKVYN
ncbi:N-acetyltransferase ESCO2 [Vespula maculifrons]|uniref:N-acetyltransferase ESCO2 n=1 Tax=Vespula maculifrons TaxID=7453 RepID=A0ABD2CG17_VESMC